MQFSTSWSSAFICSALLTAVAAPAQAEPPRAPVVTPRPVPASTPAAAKAVEAPRPDAHLASAQARLAAEKPMAVRVPAAGQASAAQSAAAAKKIIIATPHKASAERTSSAPAAPSGPAIKPETSDPGIKIAVDSKSGHILVTGVAQGPRVKYLSGYAYEGGERTKLVDYEVDRGVSFQIDHEKMPDFSADPDYTRKNQWYFSHLASTSTSKGESSVQVAQRLAENLNKGGAYRATVTETPEGAAIQLHPQQ